LAGEKFPNGAGLLYCEGQITVGVHNFGVLIGKARIISESQTVEGELVNGFISGNTTEFATDLTYNGDFIRGKRQGHGTAVNKDGSKYVGDWVDNDHHGRGIKYFKTGQK
jgi:hypothetical protein